AVGGRTPRGERCLGRGVLIEHDVHFVQGAVDGVAMLPVEVDHQPDDVVAILRHAHIGDAAAGDAIVHAAGIGELGTAQVQDDAGRTGQGKVIDVDGSVDGDDDFSAPGCRDDAERRHLTAA